MTRSTGCERPQHPGIRLASEHWPAACPASRRTNSESEHFAQASSGIRRRDLRLSFTEAARTTSSFSTSMELDRATAGRRLGALQLQLTPQGSGLGRELAMGKIKTEGVSPPASAPAKDGEGNYAVELPELLTETGSWDVRR